MATKDQLRLGAKIRNLRRREGRSQVQLAEQLGISASYLNLIEHNRRPVSAPVLLKLATLFELDLQSLAQDEEENMANDLMEIFGDPVFDAYEITGEDARELAGQSPTLGRAVLALYQAYRSSRES